MTSVDRSLLFLVLPYLKPRPTENVVQRPPTPLGCSQSYAEIFPIHRERCRGIPSLQSCVVSHLISYRASLVSSQPSRSVSFIKRPLSLVEADMARTSLWIWLNRAASILNWLLVAWLLGDHKDEWQPFKTGCSQRSSRRIRAPTPEEARHRQKGEEAAIHP